LHWYLWQFDFLWNNRQMNDGERTIAAIKAAEGKRLMYKAQLQSESILRLVSRKKTVSNSNTGFHHHTYLSTTYCQIAIERFRFRAMLQSLLF
jgi:hypothetical protein